MRVLQPWLGRKLEWHFLVFSMMSVVYASRHKSMHLLWKPDLCAYVSLSPTLCLRVALSFYAYVPSQHDLWNPNLLVLQGDVVSRACGGREMRLPWPWLDRASLWSGMGMGVLAFSACFIGWRYPNQECLKSWSLCLRMVLCHSTPSSDQSNPLSKPCLYVLQGDVVRRAFCGREKRVSRAWLERGWDGLSLQQVNDNKDWNRRPCFISVVLGGGEDGIPQVGKVC